MTYISNLLLTRETNSFGQTLLAHRDRHLVERKEDDSWTTVAAVDRTVDTSELGDKFGLWQDREVSEGQLWWKKIIRPLDGKVDADEVIAMQGIVQQPHDLYVAAESNPTYAQFDRLFPEKVTLTTDPNGGSLVTNWETQYRHVANRFSVQKNEFLIDPKTKAQP